MSGQSLPPGKAGRKGAIAQLGERLHGMQEVSGSIPLSSTIFPKIACASVVFAAFVKPDDPQTAGLTRMKFNRSMTGASEKRKRSNPVSA